MNVGAEGSQSQISEFPVRHKSKSVASDGSAYASDKEISEIDSDSDIDGVDDDFASNADNKRPKGKARQDNDLYSIQFVEGNGGFPRCGLCEQQHGPGACPMVERSEHLAEYREMLILHADDESWEERVSFIDPITTSSETNREFQSAAVQAIDEILQQRGHLSLIAGQPLHPLPKAVIAPPVPKKVKSSSNNTATATSSKPKAQPKPRKDQAMQRTQGGSNNQTGPSTNGK